MAVYGLSRALLPHVCHAVTAINGGLRLEPFSAPRRPQFIAVSVPHVCHAVTAINVGLQIEPFSAPCRPQFIAVSVSPVCQAGVRQRFYI